MALFKGLFGGNKPKGNWYDPLPATPEALPGDSFEQAFKPYATNPDKPSAFGQGGKAWQILGVLGDAMQTWGGGHGTYVPAMLDLQQQTAAEKRQLEMYKQKRSDDWTDFTRQRDYEVAHPLKADLPPMLRDANTWEAMTPEQRANYAAIERLRNPGWFTGGDGQSYQRPPTAPVGKLTMIPGGAATTAPRPFSAAPAQGFVPPARIGTGQMTSGRRTPEGNKLVGGVPNSVHLTPNAADYWGPDLPALLQDVKKFPGLRRAFIHDAGSGKHVHAEGQGWNTPYFGRRGAAGAR